MAKKANVRACPTEKEQAAVSKKERAETNRINVMSFIKTPPKNFPPQCNTIVRECFLIVDVDTSKSDQWSSTSQKWPTTIIERVKTRESAESKARRKHLPEGHVAIALSTEEYNMLDTRHFNRLQRLSEVVSPKTREEKIKEESRLARKFTDLPVKPQEKRMTRQEEESVFARVAGLESQIQTIGTHSKGQSVYSPSKKAKRSLYGPGEKIPESLKTRGEKKKEAMEKRRLESEQRIAAREAFEEKNYFGLEKIRPVELCNTQKSNCYVVVIFDGKNKAVLYTDENYKTPESAELAMKEARRKLHTRNCDAQVMSIDSFNRLKLEGYELYKRSENFNICNLEL